MALVKSIRGTKSLTITIPDNPFDQDLALELIKTFKQEIRFLAKRCRVMIVFHKPLKHSVTEQAIKVMEILGKVDLTLRIPCLKVWSSKAVSY
jgi:hypothetical protein